MLYQKGMTNALIMYTLIEKRTLSINELCQYYSTSS